MDHWTSPGSEFRTINPLIPSPALHQLSHWVPQAKGWVWPESIDHTVTNSPLWGQTSQNLKLLRSLSLPRILITTILVSLSAPLDSISAFTNVEESLRILFITQNLHMYPCMYLWRHCDPPVSTFRSTEKSILTKVDKSSNLRKNL